MSEHCKNNAQAMLTPALYQPLSLPQVIIKKSCEL